MSVGRQPREVEEVISIRGTGSEREYMFKYKDSDVGKWENWGNTIENIVDINFLGDKNRCLVKWGGRDEEIWMEPRHIGMNMLDVFMLHRDYKKGKEASAGGMLTATNDSQPASVMEDNKPVDSSERECRKRQSDGASVMSGVKDEERFSDVNQTAESGKVRIIERDVKAAAHKQDTINISEVGAETRIDRVQAAPPAVTANVMNDSNADLGLYGKLFAGEDQYSYGIVEPANLNNEKHAAADATKEEETVSEYELITIDDDYPQLARSTNTAPERYPSKVDNTAPKATVSAALSGHSEHLEKPPQVAKMVPKPTVSATTKGHSQKSSNAAVLATIQRYSHIEANITAIPTESATGKEYSAQSKKSLNAAVATTAPKAGALSGHSEQSPKPPKVAKMVSNPTASVTAKGHFEQLQKSSNAAILAEPERDSRKVPTIAPKATPSGTAKAHFEQLQKSSNATVLAPPEHYKVVNIVTTAPKPTMAATVSEHSQMSSNATVLAKTVFGTVMIVIKNQHKPKEVSDGGVVSTNQMIKQQDNPKPDHEPIMREEPQHAGAPRVLGIFDVRNSEIGADDTQLPAPTNTVSEDQSSFGVNNSANCIQLWNKDWSLKKPGEISGFHLRDKISIQIPEDAVASQTETAENEKSEPAKTSRNTNDKLGVHNLEEVDAVRKDTMNEEGQRGAEIETKTHSRPRKIPNRPVQRTQGGLPYIFERFFNRRKRALNN